MSNAGPVEAGNRKPAGCAPRLRGGLAAGLLLAAAGGACVPAQQASPAGPILSQAPVAPAPEAVLDPAAAPFALEEATVAQLQEGMRAGTHTARSLAEAYLARIEALDRRGPALRSMLDLNPDALAIADSMDAERRAGRVRGPLHGIPVVIKDNIDTADRMTTTAGSLALEGSVAARDAFVAARLREAGAVILGKTNLSEWANFRSTRSSSGWSGRGGQARNPYALDRSPCGSSSGSGVAVAANLAAAGVGTETDGSIVCPAAANGLVGLKPTVGLVSRAGIIPIAGSQDVAGPMTRTVADAAALLNVLAGPDPRDPSTTTAAARGKAEADYTRFLDPDGLRGARIGVARKGFTGYHPETDQLFDRAIAAMRQAGATVVDSVDVPHYGEYGEAEYTVLLYEFKHELNRYLAGLGPDAPVKSLADVIAFNEREKGRSMPYFGQEIMLAAQAKGPLTDKAYRDAKRKTRLAGVGVDSVMRRLKLDAIVAPTGSPAWTIDLVNGDHFLGASSSPAAVAGYPNLTVPMGYSFGLPVGISFFGRAWSEPTLIRLAYAYEQATKHRKAPRFLPTADLTVPVAP
ncbi:MAG: amidase [Gemmatimonadota bacterium]